MPANYARFLIGRQRTAAADRPLGSVLAAVAGAINAGGFLAVQQYTSHVTGMMSAIAAHLVLGQPQVVVTGLVGVLAFLCGAICCAICYAMLVNFARRHPLAPEYALPLLLESLLILCFGLLGARLARIEGLLVPVTVVLLCFIMGLQTAVATKLSNAVIRITRMTGIVTDLGIERGKLAYWNHDPKPLFHVRADRDRLTMLAGLLGCFLVGGISGALGFKYLGWVSTVPLAVLLAVLLAAMALVPVFDDWTSRPLPP